MRFTRRAIFADACPLSAGRYERAKLTFVEFAIGFHSTAEMLAACKAGDVPAFLIRETSPFTPADFTVGGAELGVLWRGSLAISTDAYALTDAERVELEAWLDRVAAGWENQNDGWGGPAVRIRDAGPSVLRDHVAREMDIVWANSVDADR